jgi:hypothetical protein
MMADPVIRERMAADSAMMRMMEEMESAMMHDQPANPTASPLDTGARLPTELILRLLADPEIEARIHSDPQLHELWSDPEVLRQLELLRQSQAADPAPRQPAQPARAAPPPPPPPPDPAHQH